MSLASSPTRRQRETIHVARLLGSGLTPAQTIRSSGIHRGQAAAHVRRLRHLRLPPWTIRSVMAVAPDEQFDLALLNLLLYRKWEQRARTKAARRAGKGVR